MTTGDTTGSKHDYVLIIVLIIALLVRLAVAFMVEMPGFSYAENARIALNMAEGNGFTFTFYGTRPDNPLRSFVPPLYTGVAFVAVRYFDDPQRALAVIHAVFGVATVGLMYLFAVKLSSDRLVGLLAAIGVALYPPFVLSIARPHTVVFNTLLLLCMLLSAVILKERRQVRWAICVGLLLGIVLHSRPMWLLLMPILVFWLWLNCRDLRMVFKLGAVVLVSMILVLAPWNLRNYRVHQQFVFISTNGGATFWNGNNPFTTGSGHEVYTRLAMDFLGREMDADQPEIMEMHRYPMPESIRDRIATIDEVELDRALRRAGMEFVRANPDKWLALVKIKLVSFVWFRPNVGSRYEASWTNIYKLLYLSLQIPFVIGLLISLRRWRVYSLLTMLFGMYIWFYAIFHVQTRFRWEIEPYLILFAALACVSVIRWAQARYA